MTEPTNCDKCNASLDNGYCYLYKGSELVGATCFKCDAQEELEKYIETKRLRSRFVTNITLDLYSLSTPGELNDIQYTKSLRYLISQGSVKEFEEFKYRVDAYCSYLKICEQIKLFESEVWFAGLKKVVNKSKVKGVSAKTKQISVLTYSMCARTMFTIENSEASVTMMCAEDSETPTMGFRGIDATEEQAINLIKLAIKKYKENTLVFKKDTAVSYL
jgi:hypothetical protein